MVAAALLAVIFRPAFHIVPWAAVAFVPALLLAFAVRFMLEWTLALSAFWTTSFPVELLMGRLSFPQAATGLAVQAAWLAACLLFIRVVWRAGVRMYSAVGA
jgi:ABC-2 type transport system permease protein